MSMQREDIDRRKVDFSDIALRRRSSRSKGPVGLATKPARMWTERVRSAQAKLRDAGVGASCLVFVMLGSTDNMEAVICSRKLTRQGARERNLPPMWTCTATAWQHNWMSG